MRQEVWGEITGAIALIGELVYDTLDLPIVVMSENRNLGGMHRILTPRHRGENLWLLVRVTLVGELRAEDILVGRSRVCTIAASDGELVSRLWGSINHQNPIQVRETINPNLRVLRKFV
jgi:hypothetical protein